MPETGLETLLAEREVVRTLQTYGRTLDLGQLEEWLDCFEPGARWRLRPAGGEVQWEHVGHEQLTAFFGWHSHAPQKRHQHLVVNVEPTVSLDEGLAHVESYFVRIDRAGDGQPAVFAFGRYHDRLRRGTDGRWRLVTRDVEYDAGPPMDGLGDSTPGLRRAVSPPPRPTA